MGVSECVREGTWEGGAGWIGWERHTKRAPGLEHSLHTVCKREESGGGIQAPRTCIDRKRGMVRRGKRGRGVLKKSRVQHDSLSSNSAAASFYH